MHAKTAGGGEGLGTFLACSGRTAAAAGAWEKAQAVLQVTEQVPNNLLKTILNLLFQSTL